MLNDFLLGLIAVLDGPSLAQAPLPIINRQLHANSREDGTYGEVVARSTKLMLTDAEFLRQQRGASNVGLRQSG